MGDEPLTRTAVILQPKGLLHRFIRHKDTSTIVERPERLRAVCVGVAAVASRLQEAWSGDNANGLGNALDTTSELTDALHRLSITGTNDPTPARLDTALDIINATDSTNFLTDPAVCFVHGEPDEYLNKLHVWASSSEDKIRVGESEIPSGLSQGDLYLCPQSIEAISGAVTAVCQGVDLVMISTSKKFEVTTSSISDTSLTPVNSEDAEFRGDNTTATATVSNDPSSIPMPMSPILSRPVTCDDSKAVTKRVFVAIRPPGHHCSDEVPSGFCFINNVVVAAAHAHLRHGIKRAIILDFDLHHGNGTQSIVWSINADTDRGEDESKARVSAGLEPLPPGLRVYYASLHDIHSFPCEDGDVALVQAASTTLSGAHGQYIENVHLDPYESDADFFGRLYGRYRDRLLGGARDFLQKTNISTESDRDTIVLISAGFDASPHEHPYMSRHNRKVPTAFYTQFAQDVRAFADEHAAGRVISVLEGGYSDLALISGTGAFLEGLAAGQSSAGSRRWWEVEDLVQLEKLTKPVARGAKPRNSKGTPQPDNPWIARTRNILTTLDPSFFSPLPPLPNLRTSPHEVPTPTSSSAKMTLRERKKPANNIKDSHQAPSPPKQKQIMRKTGGKDVGPVPHSSAGTPASTSTSFPASDSSSSTASLPTLGGSLALSAADIAHPLPESKIPPLAIMGNRDTKAPSESSNAPLMIRIKVPPRSAPPINIAETQRPRDGAVEDADAAKTSSP